MIDELLVRSDLRLGAVATCAEDDGDAIGEANLVLQINADLTLLQRAQRRQLGGDEVAVDGGEDVDVGDRAKAA